MQNIKGFIFDLDGTTANTLGDLKTAMNEMLTANGFPERTDTELLGAINYGARRFVQLSLPEKYRDNDDFITERHLEYTACYDRHFSDTTYLYPGIADTVAGLKKRGLKIAILSNKQHSHCTAIIDKLFPADTFDMVLGQTELPHKPDPTSAFVIAGRLDLRPSEIVFVGDSNIDMQTATSAGMFPVGVSWGYRQPSVLLEYGAQLIISNADELYNLL
jgi:phosphoglycolate phosphatase